MVLRRSRPSPLMGAAWRSRHWPPTCWWAARRGRRACSTWSPMRRRPARWPTWHRWCPVRVRSTPASVRASRPIVSALRMRWTVSWCGRSRLRPMRRSLCASTAARSRQWLPTQARCCCRSRWAANAIEVKVTAPDGVSVKSYGVAVGRAPSNNADLANLALIADSLPEIGAGLCPRHNELCGQRAQRYAQHQGRADGGAGECVDHGQRAGGELGRGLECVRTGGRR